MAQIKNILPPGTEIPHYFNKGTYGHWVEDQVEQAGIAVNRGKGADIAALGTEIKSKGVESNSPHSIGTMTVQDIIHTAYEDSVIFEKMQHHYTVEYSNTRRVVVSEKEYDFTNPSIQVLFKETYEQCRAEIAENWKDGIILPYVSGPNGQFEKVPNRDSYRFRIPVGAMKRIKGMAKSANQFDNLFDIVE